MLSRRSRPGSRTVLAVVLVALACVGVVVAILVGGEDPPDLELGGRVDTQAVDFDYPTDWMRTDPPVALSAVLEGGFGVPDFAAAELEADASVVGIDAANGVAVESRAASYFGFEPGSEGAESGRLSLTLDALDGAGVVEEPEPIEVAGLSGNSYRAAFTEDGTELEARIVLLSPAVIVVCQSDAEHRAEVDAGCDGVLSSLGVDPGRLGRAPIGG